MPIHDYRQGRYNQRNPVARAAILRKGGVHEKGRTSKRRQQKRELEDAISAYYLSADSEYDIDIESADQPERNSRGNKSRSNREKSTPVINNTADATTKKATVVSGFFSGRISHKTLILQQINMYSQ